VRVLVVEDQRFLADAIAEGLRREAMAVDVAYDGVAAAERIPVNDYDVVVLDRDLPGLHGDDVCRLAIAQERAARVLMLTAAGTVRDRVDGLTLGADDYLSKPFDFDELVARIRSLARRAGTSVDPVLRRSDITLDPHRRRVERKGREIHLSRKEFAVLEELMRADGGAVSSERLLEKAWDEHANPFTNAMRVTIVGLRKKLGSPVVIETVRGSGYRIA
jgi:DNA-binding response OmpR family regulator